MPSASTLKTGIVEWQPFEHRYELGLSRRRLHCRVEARITAFWWAIGRRALRPGNGYGRVYFPPALRAFASRSKIAATCAILRSAEALRCCHALAGAADE